MRSGAPKPGDVVAGKYRVENVIGEGGMGVVCAATHLVTGKRVALKWMLPELIAHEGAVERFIREAQAAGRIESAHVVDIYDVGKEGDASFLVMEFLRGEPLTKLLERNDTPLPELLGLLIGAMRGVAAAHASGVVHRDLKPDNVFICADEHADRMAKILDFGISKLSSDGDPRNRLTRTGMTLGTPYYMSPEQARGEKELDHRVDIYAFGVILYEAIAGRVPFESDTYNALILKIVTEDPPSLLGLRPDIGPPLDAVVMKAIARNRDQRYQTMTELIAAVIAAKRVLEARGTAPATHAAVAAKSSPAPATASGATRASQTPLTAEAMARALPRRRFGAVWYGVLAAVVTAAAFAFFAKGSDTRNAGSAEPHVVTPASPSVVRAAPPAPVQEPVRALPPAPVKEPVPAAPPAKAAAPALPDGGVSAATALEHPSASGASDQAALPAGPGPKTSGAASNLPRKAHAGLRAAAELAAPAPSAGPAAATPATPPKRNASTPSGAKLRSGAINRSDF